MEDVYTQNAVKLENIKAGEATEVAKLLDEAHNSLLQKIDHDKNHQERCVDLYVKNYTAKAAVSQIMKSFN